MSLRSLKNVVSLSPLIRFFLQLGKANYPINILYKSLSVAGKRITSAAIIDGKKQLKPSCLCFSGLLSTSFRTICCDPAKIRVFFVLTAYLSRLGEGLVNKSRMHPGGTSPALSAPIEPINVTFAPKDARLSSTFAAPPQTILVID